MKQILNEWRKFLNETPNPDPDDILDSPDVEEGDPWKFTKYEGGWWAQKNGQGKWHDISSARYEKTLEKLNAAYPTLSVDIADLEQPAQAAQPADSSNRNNTSAATVHLFEVEDNPKLIYVYPGWPAAKQHNHANGYISGSGLLSKHNTIIVVAKSFNTPWSSLELAGIDALDGKTPSSIRIVGHSRGAEGLASAMSSASFDKVIYADPNPEFLIGKQHGNAIMYYNPSNWRKGNRHLGEKQNELAAEMGANARTSEFSEDYNHDPILEKSIQELVE
jgi:hypothetical protein